MNLGKNIIYYRKELQITQEDLAERLYVSRQTISRWENESVIPDVETIIKLCDIFGCDMDTLVRKDAAEKAAPSEMQNEEEQAPQRTISIQVKHRSRYRINNVICSVTMLVATFVFFMLGSFKGGWGYAWVSYAVGALVCAISSVITYS